MKNDPFTSREQAFKTLLTIDNNKCLAGYIRDLNDTKPESAYVIRDYFLELYEKFPNDFDLVFEKDPTALALKFMGKEIISFQSPMALRSSRIDDFFTYWDYVLESARYDNE